MIIKKELRLIAKIDRPEKTLERIKEFAKPIGSERVEEFLFNFKNKEDAELQLIHDPKFTKVIFRTKTNHRNLLENYLSSFTVNEPEEFVGFLESAGFELSSKIVKAAQRFSFDGIEIELTNIRELGNFVEITSYNSSDEGNARKKILEIAKELGVKSKKVLPNFYVSLLK